MDTRLLRTLFVVPLATCTVSHATPTMHSLVAPASEPAHHWPQPSERPEPEHPAHGEGSGESATVVGIGASGIYTNATAQQVWFNSTDISGAPSRFLDEPFLRPLPKLTIRVQTKAKLAVRPIRRTVGARSGR